MNNFFTAADNLILLFENGGLAKNFPLYDLVAETAQAKEEVETIIEDLEAVENKISQEGETEELRYQQALFEDGATYLDNKFDELRTRLALALPQWKIQ